MPTGMSIICCSVMLLNESIYTMISLRIANYYTFRYIFNHQSVIINVFRSHNWNATDPWSPCMQLHFDWIWSIKSIIKIRCCCLLSIAASMFLFFSLFIKLFTMIGCHVVLTDDHGIIYETIIQQYSIVRIDFSSFFFLFSLDLICEAFVWENWLFFSCEGDPYQVCLCLCMLTVHFCTKCDQSRSKCESLMHF